jgi:hypothetical protein
MAVDRVIQELMDLIEPPRQEIPLHRSSRSARRVMLARGALSTPTYRSCEVTTRRGRRSILCGICSSIIIRASRYRHCLNSSRSNCLRARSPARLYKREIRDSLRRAARNHLRALLYRQSRSFRSRTEDRIRLLNLVRSHRRLNLHNSNHLVPASARR